ncbi:MAG: L-serine ammonia-lyase, iron-sulfur-dependent, subunit alpha, partial [Ruminococcaceae bacterium]|nr:L-serine ammonia-lyase, iron-sulfur-dependent, subunit alpha [Oscillospiraceae bacterium]
MLKYDSIAELVDAAERAGMAISEVALEDQADSLRQDAAMLFRQMDKSFTVMQQAIEFGQREDQKSMSGLTGGEGWRMKQYSAQRAGGLCGLFLTRAMSRALAVAGCNASMGKIVAAPTAGSCGILPGCLV